MLMNPPRVSVLMTVYNAAPFLRESIGSVQAQSFSDWELVIVDDGSTDASASILAACTDPRIKIFSFARNIGRTPALRYAFDHAAGEYIAVLDADDRSHPARLKRQVEFLDRQQDVVLVGSWAEHIDKRGAVTGTWEPPVKTDALNDLTGWRDPFVHSSVMFRKKEAAAAGGYPEEYVYAQDFALILQLIQKGKAAIIGEHLCQLRMGDGSMTFSGKYRLAIAREELSLMRYAGKILPLSPEGRYLNRRAAAKGEFRYGRALFLQGRLFAGIGGMARGLFCFAVSGIGSWGYKK